MSLGVTGLEGSRNSLAPRPFSCYSVFHSFRADKRIRCDRSLSLCVCVRGITIRSQCIGYLVEHSSSSSSSSTFLSFFLSFHLFCAELSDDDGNRCVQTGLIAAAYSGQMEVLKYLLDNGADPNLADADVRLSLSHALFFFPRLLGRLSHALSLRLFLSEM